MVDWSSFIRSPSNGQNQIAIDSVAGTGDGSEYDIKKVVVVFQEWYRYRGSSEPASVNVIDDLTWLVTINGIDESTVFKFLQDSI